MSDNTCYDPLLTISALGHVSQQGVSKCFRACISFVNHSIVESIIAEDREPSRSFFDTTFPPTDPVLLCNPSLQRRVH